MFYHAIVESPVGQIQVIGKDDAIVRVDFTHGSLNDCDQYILKHFGIVHYENECSIEVQKTRQELTEYFAGKRQTFDLKLKLYGTEYYQNAWRHLCEIPYGELISYKQHAINCGSPKGFRSIGQANHHNPISIIIPCHRVIGTNKKLTGYGSGLEIKQFLIDFEREVSTNQLRFEY